MDALWPWLVVAGAGALHGLMPTSGWALAAACGARSGDRRAVLRALAPIALGHATSIAMVASLIAFGALDPSMDTGPLQGPALVLLAAVGLHHAWQHRPGAAPRAPHRLVGRDVWREMGLALSGFLASTLHGTGLMLVPALLPLCLGNSPARAITASGSLGLALAAVGLHTAAMLVVTAALALGARRGVAALLADAPNVTVSGAPTGTAAIQASAANRRVARAVPSRGCDRRA